MLSISTRIASEIQDQLQTISQSTDKETIQSALDVIEKDLAAIGNKKFTAKRASSITPILDAVLTLRSIGEKEHDVRAMVFKVQTHIFSSKQKRERLKELATTGYTNNLTWAAGETAHIKDEVEILAKSLPRNELELTLKEALSARKANQSEYSTSNDSITGTIYDDFIQPILKQLPSIPPEIASFILTNLNTYDFKENDALENVNDALENVIEEVLVKCPKIEKFGTQYFALHNALNNLNVSDQSDLRTILEAKTKTTKELKEAYLSSQSPNHRTAYAKAMPKKTAHTLIQHFAKQKLNSEQFNKMVLPLINAHPGYSMDTTLKLINNSNSLTLQNLQNLFANSAHATKKHLGKLFAILQKAGMSNTDHKVLAQKTGEIVSALASKMPSKIRIQWLDMLAQKPQNPLFVISFTLPVIKSMKSISFQLVIQILTQINKARFAENEVILEVANQFAEKLPELNQYQYDAIAKLSGKIRDKHRVDIVTIFTPLKPK